MFIGVSRGKDDNDHMSLQKAHAKALLEAPPVAVTFMNFYIPIC